MNYPGEQKKAPACNLTANSRDDGIDQCRRCGRCCRKGGPALHKEDKRLIETGMIPAGNIFTLRKGEMAHDNVRNRLTPLENEIIKIKGTDDTWTCLFYDPHARTCRIYTHRPLECRVLACWDTAAIERIYAVDRLTRQDLLGAVDGLWEIVETHEKRCAHRKIRKWVHQLNGAGRAAALDALHETIAYDRHIRALVVAKSGIKPALLDFLFGRPLGKILETYDIAVKHKKPSFL